MGRDPQSSPSLQQFISTRVRPLSTSLAASPMTYCSVVLEIVQFGRGVTGIGRAESDVRPGVLHEASS
jgi:hypothetical protein